MEHSRVKNAEPMDGATAMCFFPPSLCASATYLFRPIRSVRQTCCHDQPDSASRSAIRCQCLPVFICQILSLLRERKTTFSRNFSFLLFSPFLRYMMHSPEYEESIFFEKGRRDQPLVCAGARFPILNAGVLCEHRK